MILMIHGAGATSLSFNYISLWLDQEIQFLDYRVGETRDEIFQRIERPDEIQYIIGHSYGGLLASLWLGQTKRNYCKGLVTIAVNSARSTPTGFSKCHSVEIPHGHAEILQSWDTVEHIRKFLDNPQGHFVQQATRSEEHIRNSMAQIQLGYDPLMKRNR